MEHLIALSAKVEESVRLSIQALEEKDKELAKKLYELDAEIDEKEIEIEEECLKIFALHQPVAIDLRYLVAVLKINNDLERIGDLALNIAKHAIHIMDTKKTVKGFQFHLITQKVQEMLKNSLDALINLSPDIAYRVLATDDQVDDMNKEINLQISEEIKQKPDQLDVLIHHIHIARHLERIADHTTNIAEDIIYLTKGDIIRHHKPEKSSEKV
jgi:phosphate transport system protein